MWFYVWEHLKAQPAGLKTSRTIGRQCHDIVSSNRLVETGIELRTPGYKATCSLVVEMNFYVCMSRKLKKISTSACSRHGYL